MISAGIFVFLGARLLFFFPPIGVGKDGLRHYRPTFCVSFMFSSLHSIIFSLLPIDVGKDGFRLYRPTICFLFMFFFSLVPDFFFLVVFVSHRRR